MGCNQYNIKEYLEKFWNGEATLEEEKQIRDFFQYNTVPEEFQTDADYFYFIRNTQEENVLGDDFDDEILFLLEEKKKPRGLMYFLNSSIARVAVAVVLIFGIGFMIWKPKPVNKNTLANSNNVKIENNEQLQIIEKQIESSPSYKKTKNTFLLIGNKMNTVLKHAEKINKLKQLDTKKEK